MTLMGGTSSTKSVDDVEMEVVGFGPTSRADLARACVRTSSSNCSFSTCTKEFNGNVGYGDNICLVLSNKYRNFAKSSRLQAP